MEQCIITRIEYVNGSVIHTPVGYTTNEVDCNSINADYDSTLSSWVSSNISALENSTKSISEFFDTTPIVYMARTIVNYDSELTEITDINSL